MNDYVSGEELIDEEETANIVFDSSKPKSYEVTMQDEKWKVAMDSKMNSIIRNGTQELADLPAGAKNIGVRWIYKTKLNELGQVDKYTARLVAGGYTQRYGIDYKEVFAPVSRLDTIRMIIAKATHRGWTLYHLDVKSFFLGDLSLKRGGEHMVYKL